MTTTRSMEDTEGDTDLRLADLATSLDGDADARPLLAPLHVPIFNRKDHVRQPSIDRQRLRLLAELPITERRLWVAGISTSILEGGSGPPLVLLHGGYECGGLVWGPVVARLARNHRLLIPDIPGLGESKPVARLNHAFDTWFARLLELTCQERPILAAHSLSGGLAAGFAVRYGGLLSRLVIYASPSLRPQPNAPGRVLRAIRLTVQPSARDRDRLPCRFLSGADATRQQDRQWYEALETYTRSRRSHPQVRRTMGQLLDSRIQRTPDADLERIAVPTSLLWGRHDRTVPLRVAEAANRRFGWPLQVIDDAGSLPHLEQPESFCRALTDQRLGATCLPAANRAKDF